MPGKVSLVIIAQNSERTLGDCLKSVQGFVSEIVLVDGFSSDGTVAVAEKFGARIFRKELTNFGEQKQFALEQAGGDWIFLLDSDETASAELVDEMKKIVTSGGAGSVYRLPRRNYHFGKWLRYGGKYPDYQTRFFKKGAARFSSDVVHEKLISKDQVLTLRSWIRHDSYPDKDVWLRKLKLFSEFRAQELRMKGVRPSAFTGFLYCLWRPVTRFIRRYVFKGGFLDGVEGFLACLHDALTEILTYLLLKEDVRTEGKKGGHAV